MAGISGIPSWEETHGDEKFQSTDKVKSAEANSSWDSRNDHECPGYSSSDKHFEGDGHLQQDPEETSDSPMPVFNYTALPKEERLPALLEYLKQLNVELTRERIQADKKRNEDREKIDSLKKDLGTWNETLEKALRETKLGTWNEALNKASREIKENMKELEEDKNKLKNDTDILRCYVKKNETLSHLLNSLQEKVQNLEEKLKQMQRSNEKTFPEKLTAKDEEIDELKQTLNSMRNVVQEKYEQIAAKDETIRRLQTEKQNLIQQLNSTRNLVQEKDEVTVLKNETIREFQVENQNLIQQSNFLPCSHCLWNEEQQAALQATRIERDTAKDELSTVKVERDTAKSEVITLKAELDSAKRDVASFQAERDAARLKADRVKAELVTTERSYVQLKEENMSFQKKIDELQKKDDIISKKATEAEKKDQALEQENGAKNQETAELMPQNRTLEQENGKKNQETAELTPQISEAKSLALQFMSTHPCCIRVIPYKNDGEDNKSITMYLYVSTNGKGIPDSVKEDAKEMFVNCHIEFVDLQRRPLNKIFIPLPSSEKLREEEISNLSRKIEENLHLFNNRLNVTAVQASYKVIDSEEQDIPCVAVYVLGKTKIPAGETDIKKIKDDNHVFDGVEFDVLEGYYQPAIIASQESYVWPLRAGYGIGVQGTDSSGTLGGFLEDKDGKHYILSNEHVLRSRDTGSNVILQPSQSDYEKMCARAEASLNELPSLTEQEQTAFPDAMRRREKIIEQRRNILKDAKTKTPREIGNYVDGLRKNLSMPLGNNDFQIFVDAAIAELNATEETDLKLMSKTCGRPYGFEQTENATNPPNGEIVSYKDFVDRLRTQSSELSFNKSGRTTGFTKDGRAGQKDVFVKIYTEMTVPGDKRIASGCCHALYRLCKDCKLSGASLEQMRHNQNMKCTSCLKNLNAEEQVESFWARNCLVIRNYRKAFCDYGDSGALVFDEDGNAWGLVHGLFDDETREMVFCLASPLCLTLKALEQKSGKKELKLWRV